MKTTYFGKEVKVREELTVENIWRVLDNLEKGEDAVKKLVEEFWMSEDFARASVKKYLESKNKSDELTFEEFARMLNGK